MNEVWYWKIDETAIAQFSSFELAEQILSKLVDSQIKIPHGDKEIMVNVSDIHIDNQ